MNLDGILGKDCHTTAQDLVRVAVEANNGIPNNPDFPALIYPQVLRSGCSADAVMALYAANRWGRAWVYGVFDFHHYHYAAHEVLTVISGGGRLQLGGEEGSCHDVVSGDVVVLPAGFGHRLVRADRGFAVAGAYPEDQKDTGFSTAGEGIALEAASARGLPACDPIYGANGPLRNLWRVAGRPDGLHKTA